MSVSGVVVGTVLGGLFGYLFTMTFAGPLDWKERLTACAKSNNVYQCEMVAVPKSGGK